MPSIAENRFPSFDLSVISGFPVGQHRRDLEARMNTESESRLVLKTNVNGGIFRIKRQFHFSDDLAFDLREPENFPYSAGAGNFMVSHVASCTGDLVRAAFVRKHECGPLPLYLGCHRTQA
jgi:hypothetical protein